MAAGTCRAPSTKPAVPGAGGSLQGPQASALAAAPRFKGETEQANICHGCFGGARAAGVEVRRLWGWAVCPAAGPGAIWQAGRDEVRLDDAQGSGRFQTRGLCFGNPSSAPTVGGSTGGVKLPRCHCSELGKLPLRCPDSSQCSPTTTGRRGRRSRSSAGDTPRCPRPCPGQAVPAKAQTFLLLLF